MRIIIKLGPSVHKGWQSRNSKRYSEPRRIHTAKQNKTHPMPLEKSLLLREHIQHHTVPTPSDHLGRDRISKENLEKIRSLIIKEAPKPRKESNWALVHMMRRKTCRSLE